MKSVVAIVTPAEVTALTTVERVKLELSITGSENDQLLQYKIEEATSDIAIRVGPLLRRETVAETFWPEAPSRYSAGWRPSSVPSLRLRLYPVASVNSVTIDGVLLDAAEYRLDDAAMLYRLSAGAPIVWAFSKTAVIEYDAGYLLPDDGSNRDLPASLEAAAIALVSSYWMSRGRDPMIKAETNVGVYEYQYWVGAVGKAGELPPDVMTRLEPYLRAPSLA